MTDQTLFTVKNKHILQSGLFNETLREWQGLKSEIRASSLMYPVFIIENDDDIEPITSMPGVFRFGINKLRDHLHIQVENGLRSILLFGVIDSLPKGNQQYTQFFFICLQGCELIEFISEDRSIRKFVGRPKYTEAMDTDCWNNVM